MYKGHAMASVCVGRLRGKSIDFEIFLKERITRRKRDGGWFVEALTDLRPEIQRSDAILGENVDWEGSFGVERSKIKDPAFDSMIRRNRLQEFCVMLNSDLRVFTHHYCHARAAVQVSPFRQALIVVQDGVGNTTAAFGRRHPESNRFPYPFQGDDDKFPAETLTTYLQKNDRIECVDKIWQICESTKIRGQKYFSDGLGVLYDTVSNYVFNSTDEAGKVMGLAPFGKTPAVIGSDRVRFAKSMNWSKAFSQRGKRQWEESGHFEEFSNLAAGMQNHFEASLFKYLRGLKKKFPDQENLILTGGCALNCVANMKIVESGLFKRVYVPPFPGDESISLGVVATLASGLPQYRWSPVPLQKQRANFGPLSSVPKARPKAAVPYLKIAKLLADGKVIAWFQGRSESGPRALGNRSILASPASEEIRKYLNDRIKGRESFRPYGCSVVWEKAHQYFEIPKGFDSPFMSFAPRVRPKFAKYLQAVTHVDGTSRIQTVRKTQDPVYYRLLEVFGKQTGIACLLNTSMNIMGEPLVETREDAMRFFKSTPVDAIVIGNRLILK